MPMLADCIVYLTIVDSRDVKIGWQTKRAHALLTLQELFEPVQVDKALHSYFRSWHRICRITHRPSFSVSSMPHLALVAMIMLGTMYAPCEENRKKATTVLDYAEDYIFAHEPSPPHPSQDDANRVDTVKSCFLEASFLMIVTQYWTGDSESKRRVSTLRFDRTAEVKPDSQCRQIRQLTEL